MKRNLFLSTLAILVVSGTTPLFAQAVQQADQLVSKEIAATVDKVSLPEIVLDKSMNEFVVPVTTTAIDAKNNLVGFQGDFTFDERVVSFQEPVIQKAGITGGNWNVSGNVLPGQGPIRTLRISAFSNDFVPLNGSGILFELRMKRVSKGGESSPLKWAAPPDHFFFIDADLNTQGPPRLCRAAPVLKVPGTRPPKCGSPNRMPGMCLM